MPIRHKKWEIIMIVLQNTTHRKKFSTMFLQEHFSIFNGHVRL